MSFAFMILNGKNWPSPFFETQRNDFQTTEMFTYFFIFPIFCAIDLVTRLDELQGPCKITR